MAKHKIQKKNPNTPLKRVCVKEEPPKEEPPKEERKVEQTEEPIAEAKEEQKENASLVSHEDNLFEQETQKEDETSTDNIFEKETQQGEEEESQYQYPTDNEIIDLTGDN